MIAGKRKYSAAVRKAAALHLNRVSATSHLVTDDYSRQVHEQLKDMEAKGELAGLVDAMKIPDGVIAAPPPEIRLPIEFQSQPLTPPTTFRHNGVTCAGGLELESAGPDDEIEGPMAAKIVTGVMLAQLEYFVAADGRGNFNAEAIACRVVGMASHLGLALPCAPSVRVLAEELGVAQSVVHRQISKVKSDLLVMGDAFSGDAMAAAKTAIQSLAAVTTKKL